MVAYQKVLHYLYIIYIYIIIYNADKHYFLIKEEKEVMENWEQGIWRLQGPLSGQMVREWKNVRCRVIHGRLTQA